MIQNATLNVDLNLEDLPGKLHRLYIISTLSSESTLNHSVDGAGPETVPCRFFFLWLTSSSFTEKAEVYWELPSSSLWQEKWLQCGNTIHRGETKARLSYFGKSCHGDCPEAWGREGWAAGWRGVSAYSPRLRIQQHSHIPFKLLMMPAWTLNLTRYAVLFFFKCFIFPLALRGSHGDKSHLFIIVLLNITIPDKAYRSVHVFKMFLLW